jgi:hypothetical protein
MADVILVNVRLCALEDGQNRTYVSNSGHIAGVSDRVDLRNDTETIERAPEAVKLDAPRVDRQNGCDILR